MSLTQTNYYFLGEHIIFPLSSTDDRPLTEIIFEGLDLNFHIRERTNEEQLRLKQEYSTLRDRLSEMVPEFFDDTLDFATFPFVQNKIRYRKKLDNGTARIKLTVTNNLRDFISENSSIFNLKDEILQDLVADLSKTLESDTGFILHGKYTWNGNNARGLWLPRWRSPYPCQSFDLFAQILNYVCFGKTDRQLVQRISISDYVGHKESEEISLPLRHLTLRGLREADPVVANFMQYMHEHRREINTIGECLDFASRANTLIQQNSERDVLPCLSEDLTVSRDTYLEKAREIFSKMTPEFYYGRH